MVELQAKANLQRTFGQQGDPKAGLRFIRIKKRMLENQAVAVALNEQMSRMDQGQSRAAGSAKKFGSRLSGLGRGLSRAISRVQQMTFVVIALGTALLRTTTRLASIGSAVVGSQNAFQETAKAIDETSDSLLTGLREASRGAISDMGLMASANFAFLAGARLSREEVIKLTEASVKLAGAGIRTTAGEVLSATNIFNRFTQGIVKQERRIVDDMTVIIRAKDVMKEFGAAALIAAKGDATLARTIAFKSAIVKAATDRLETLKDVNIEQALVGSKLTTVFENFSNAIGELFVKSGAAEKLLTAVDVVLGQILERFQQPGVAEDFFDGLIKAVVVMIRLFEKLIPILVAVAGWMDVIFGAVAGGTAGFGLGSAIGAAFGPGGAVLGGLIGGGLGAIGGGAAAFVSGDVASDVEPEQVGDSIADALKPAFRVNEEGLARVNEQIRRGILQPEVTTVV